MFGNWWNKKDKDKIIWLILLLFKFEVRLENKMKLKDDKILYFCVPNNEQCV